MPRASRGFSSQRAAFDPQPAVGNAITGAFIGAVDDGVTSSTSTTFTGAAIGTAATYRRIVVGVVATHTSGTPSFSSVTLAGNAMTPIIGSGAANARHAAIYTYDLDTGTTADIVVTMTATCSKWAILVWTVTGTTAVPTLTDQNAGTSTDSGNAITTAVTVATGGFAVSVGANAGNGVAVAADVAGITEDSDAQIAAAVARKYGSSTTNTGSVTFTHNGGDFIFYRAVSASWQP